MKTIPPQSKDSMRFKRGSFITKFKESLGTSPIVSQEILLPSCHDLCEVDSPAAFPISVISMVSHAEGSQQRTSEVMPCL